VAIQFLQGQQKYYRPKLDNTKDIPGSDKIYFSSDKKGKRFFYWF